MKRDMELVRKILLRIDAHEHGFAPKPLQIDGYTNEQVGYHVHIMIQGGLLEGVNVTAMGSESPESVPSVLTWAGHEFIDAARDESNWKRAMEKVKKTVGTVSIGVMTQLLTKTMTQTLGL